MVPLLSNQAATRIATSLLREDNEMAVWWGTWTECAVAISRLGREGGLDEETEEEARIALDRLVDDEWLEIEPTDEIRLLAVLISKRYPLKAADALQLAAALRWCEGDTEAADFVCLDDQLRAAALGEGFMVLPERSASEIEAGEDG